MFSGSPVKFLEFDATGGLSKPSTKRAKKRVFTEGDKYQLRDFTGIKTHIAFVSTVYSMLEYASHDQELLSKFRQRLDIEPTGTLAFLRKLMKADGLMVLIEFIFLQSQKGQSIDNTISLLVPYGLK